MKAKGIRLMAVLLFTSVVLTGCLPLVEDVPQDKVFYSTFYPIYALTAAIADGAENLEIHCLSQPQDGCIRAYTLSDWDLYMLIYSADAIISGGNGLESFADQLKNLGEKILPVAEVMLGLDFYRMNETGEGHFSGENPHLYMSVQGAEMIMENIAGALSLLDEDNADIYEENKIQMQSKLQEIGRTIDKETEVCGNIPAAVLNEALFYTATDCGLKIVDVCERESSEMLYGENLDNCLDNLIESGAKVILIEKQAPLKLIEALEGAGFSVAKLDVMSEMSEKDGAEGYFERLIENAQVVAAACRAIQR